MYKLKTRLDLVYLINRKCYTRAENLKALKLLSWDKLSRKSKSCFCEKISDEKSISEIVIQLLIHTLTDLNCNRNNTTYILRLCIGHYISPVIKSACAIPYNTASHPRKQSQKFRFIL